MKYRAKRPYISKFVAIRLPRNANFRVQAAADLSDTAYKTREPIWLKKIRWPGDKRAKPQEMDYRVPKWR